LPALTKAAVATDADFYHGHCLGGLAAAALAAKSTGKRYGFDAEDFHETETTEVEEEIFENSAVVRLLRAFLGGASIRTAASPLIAEAYEQAYGTRMATIFNSFDALPERKSSDAARDFRRDDPAKLYWFSQTIGPGRGLEQMIHVLARAKTPARLQLRGFAGAAYRAELERTAGQAGVDLEFLPPANPGDMVALAAQADVGLSLEQRTPGNRDLCLTNKVFAYLAAGVPQLMSRTSAQESFAAEVGDAALVVNLNDAAATSQSLDALLGSKDRLMAARRAAASAQKRFGWPVEKEKLLQLFNKAV
jgi:glycosyltransferase involved in cell wall biosynthesis